jgi:hypothetical protein
MNQITEQVSAILLAVVGVAILAVLVSRNSNTSGVLKAGGNAFASILGAATAPVMGGQGGFGVGALNNPVPQLNGMGWNG